MADMWAHKETRDKPRRLLLPLLMLLACSLLMGDGCNSNTNPTEGGDHKAALRQKKLMAKSLKWTSSNKDMNSKLETGRCEAIYDDTVLCSLTAASFNGLISRKNSRTTHGKVAQHCDAIDPPVPRRLRSAINKRVRHVKKRRHLSAISAQISFVDQRTRLNETSLLTEEEEVADALLSLSQITSTCEFTADKVMVDSTDINVSSTSYSEGATKESEKTSRLPTAADELSTQAACIVERTDNVPHVNPVSGATNQPNNINLPNLETVQTKDLSSGVVVNLPSPCKDSSSNSARKQLKVPLDDDSKNCPTQKAQDWPVDSDKTDKLVRENGKAKNGSAQEMMHQVQTPLPCTPDGYLIKPSSTKLTVRANAVSEFSKVSWSGNPNKIPQVNNNGVPSKSWKRSITHVYVSHLIQMHVNKEKAASHCQAIKPEERPRMHTSRSPAGPTPLHKGQGNARDETCYAVHLDVRLPVQASPGICNMSATRQKMVSGNLMNLPTSTALPGQYLHPQMTPRGPMPYPYPHIPHSRSNLGPPATLQQMQQYMCTPAYAPRPGVTANSSAVMKLQQHIPTQQQQQMWQFHVAQYQPRPTDAALPGATWHNMPSLRPLSMLPAPAMPTPQMDLLCAPYQQGGARQPQQLRLI